MKTYIINLERSKSRHSHILEEVNKHSLDYEIVPAVDGSRFTKEEMNEIADMKIVSQHPKWLTPPAIATALSHRKVYERMVEEKIEIALIIEDDIVFADNFTKIIDPIKPHLSDSEVVLLHYVSFKSLNISEQNSINLFNPYRLMFPCALNIASAAAYIITQKAAQSLLDWVLPVRFASDCWYDFYINDKIKTVRLVYPMPVKVVGAKSTISMSSKETWLGWLTETIEDYKIPPFHQILKRRRLRNVERWSNFILTNEKSSLER